MEKKKLLSTVEKAGLLTCVRLPCRAAPRGLAAAAPLHVGPLPASRPALLPAAPLAHMRLLPPPRPRVCRSAAEKAGLSLGKIEKLGLLSTAERLGLLTLAEDLLTTDPGKISSGEWTAWQQGACAARV